MVATSAQERGSPSGGPGRLTARRGSASAARGRARSRGPAASAGRTRASAAAARGCPRASSSDGPAQDVVDQRVERLAASGPGCAARTGAPRGRSGRTASGSGSGRRSRRPSRAAATVRSPIGRPSTRISPAVGSMQPHRRPEQRRLARAVRAEHRDDLAAAEAGVDAAQDLARRRSRPGRRGTRAAAGASARGLGPARRLVAAPALASARSARRRLARTRSRTTSNGSLTASGSAISRKPVDRAEIARRALVEVQDPIRPELERLLDAVLDDDDRVALVGQAPGGAGGAARRWPGRGWRAARRRRTARGRIIRIPAAATSWRSPPDRAAVSRPARASISVRSTTVRIRSRISARVACPRFSGPERELRLDRRADDLLGRILEHRPDRPGDLAQAELRRRRAGDPDRARSGRRGRRAGSGR